ncbi:hypothetical protein SLEP1_g21112 [Rubroshorea leprosula]|uniref:Uncharacterized protein n=1 Tax=Rubroshorea leprosula TaxID=152421 RepID=A0AAV5JFG0_9ROSI|nr:hypothetical protein SLEP1_g21112 [Rubroshorea leprosula]
MLELPCFPAAQVCWNRPVLPPPMTLPGDPRLFLADLGRCSLIFQIWPLSEWISAAMSWRFRAILSRVD